MGLLQAAPDEGVQFQAVLALREMVLGRWAVLGKPTQQATLQFLLQLALARLAADPRPLLRTQASAATGGGGAAEEASGQRGCANGTHLAG